MLNLISIAIAPALICIIYIYIRDKYEKEPIKLLSIGICLGMLISAPILKTEQLILSYMPVGGVYFDAFYNSFIVASSVEEFFKFLILYLLIWRNVNFNEKFDGIVYAVFISLGFAGLENVLYVLSPVVGGVDTGISRAFFSVPSHGFFGVFMGYYFALSKFDKKNKNIYMIKAFIFPYVIHGLYDFILLSNIFSALIPFYIFVGLIWLRGFSNMKKHIDSSPFRSAKKNNV